MFFRVSIRCSRPPSVFSRRLFFGRYFSPPMFAPNPKACLRFRTVSNRSAVSNRLSAVFRSVNAKIRVSCAMPDFHRNARIADLSPKFCRTYSSRTLRKGKELLFAESEQLLRMKRLRSESASKAENQSFRSSLGSMSMIFSSRSCSSRIVLTPYEVRKVPIKSIKPENST